MSANWKNYASQAVIVVAGFAVVAALSTHIQTIRPQLPKGFEDSDLAVQGKKLKGYALGAEGMIADWYWIISLQYLGEKFVARANEDINLDDLRSLNPRLLYPYLDNATDLDPKFFAAYSYGAVVLPAIDRADAIALTEKGIANNPDAWRLYQYLGYIYWREKNYQKAAQVYEAGSKIRGSPPFMRQMAAAMLSKGGSREIARQMYEQMLAEAEDEQSKRNAQLRLYELDSIDELEAINRLLAEQRSATGVCPARVSDIFPRLRTVDLPNGGDFRIDSNNALVDPSGVPYRFDQAKCQMALSFESKIPKPIN